MRALLPFSSFASAVVLCSALPALSAFALGCGGSPAPATTTPDNSALTATPVPKGPDKPESEKVTWKKDPAAKNCHTSGSADLVAGVAAISKGCVDTAKMHKVGDTAKGEGGGTGKMVTTLPLKAQANHCYRVFGLGEKTITDMDIAVMDSAGKMAGEDSTDSNESIVPESASICFNADDDANVNVAIGNGQGKWAVEIWSD
jgi:hypothetical protein